MPDDTTRPPIPRWRQVSTNHWYEGALLGNGDVGVVAFGCVDWLVFAVGKNDVWDRRCNIFNHKLSMQQFLHLVEQHGEQWHQFVEASQVRPRGVCDEPYQEPQPKPVCRIEVAHAVGGSWPNTAPLYPIEHDLCLAEATLTSRGVGLLTTARVQKDTNLVVLRVAETSRPVEITLSRHADTAQTGIKPPTHLVDGAAGLVIQDMPAERTYPKGFRCVVAGALLSGQAPTTDGPAIRWRAGPGDQLILAVVTTRDDHDPATAAKRLLADGLRAGEAALFAQHLAAWRRFWDASWIEIDDDLVQRLWYAHNYLLASSARPGAVAPGLYGPWIVNDKQMWRGSYTTDYNFQQTFTAALSCNHPELLEPYFAVLEEMLPAARQFAVDLFESKGIAFPHEMYPIDMTGHGDGSACYLCETPWLVRHFWEYYLHTGDVDFLRRRAWPMLSETANMIAGFATPRPDGSYSLFPTRSCEHHRLQKGLPFNRDCIADLALCRYLLQAAVKASQLLAENSDRVEQWRQVLENLSDWPRARTQSGEIFVDALACPPERDFAPPVRFSSGARPSKRPGNDGPWMTYNLPNSVFPVWPGGQIDADSPPEILLAAIRTWLTLKVEGCDDLIIRHMAAARLGVPALEQLKRELEPRLMPNGSMTEMMNRLFAGDDQTPLMYRANGVYV